MFCSVAAIVFFLLGQVVVVYYRQLAHLELNSAKILQVHHKLLMATCHLKDHFTAILLTSLTHIFFTMTLHFYNFLIEVRDVKVLVTAIWDGLLVVDCFIRLWIICKTTEMISHSVKIRLFSIFLNKIQMIVNYRLWTVWRPCGMWEIPLPT